MLEEFETEPGVSGAAPMSVIWSSRATIDLECVMLAQPWGRTFINGDGTEVVMRDGRRTVVSAPYAYFCARWRAAKTAAP